MDGYEERTRVFYMIHFSLYIANNPINEQVFNIQECEEYSLLWYTDPCNAHKPRTHFINKNKLFHPTIFSNICTLKCDKKQLTVIDEYKLFSSFFIIVLFYFLGQ